MENKLAEKKRWPPFCCVPAFIEQALAQCNVKIDDLRSFAHQLGVRVGAGEENPWGLEVTEDPDARGLTATSAADVVTILVPFYTVVFLTSLLNKSLVYIKLVLEKVRIRKGG